MESALQAYFRELKTALEAKDPRVVGVQPCSLQLSFPKQGQVTITVGARKTSVETGDTRDRDDLLPTCTVRTDLPTWIGVVSGELALRAAQVEIFGDHQVLASVGKLVDQKRSAVSARFFH